MKYKAVALLLGFALGAALTPVLIANPVLWIVVPFVLAAAMVVVEGL